MIKQILALCALISLFAPSTITYSADTVPVLGASGNPLPRFASLRAPTAYMRTGPGRQYPIEWVYERPGLPLEIIEEDGPWRKVRDNEGVSGWMLVSLLSSKRTALITGKSQNLTIKPNGTSPVIIIAEGGVIGRLLECAPSWCQLEISDNKGWIDRRYLWGVYANEEFD